MSFRLHRRSKGTFLVMLTGLLYTNYCDSVAGDKSDRAETTQVNQVTDTIELEDIIWSGDIKAGQTRNFTINVNFPYEGKFYVEATLASFNRNLYGWTNVTKKGLCVTTSKTNEANVKAAGLSECRGVPPVKGVKITGAAGVSAPAFDTLQVDTTEDTAKYQYPKVVIQPYIDKGKYRSGEGPFSIKLEFKSDPKIDQVVALCLSAISAVDFDSMSVMLTFTPDSVHVENQK